MQYSIICLVLAGRLNCPAAPAGSQVGHWWRRKELAFYCLAALAGAPLAQVTDDDQQRKQQSETGGGDGGGLESKQKKKKRVGVWGQGGIRENELDRKGQKTSCEEAKQENIVSGWWCNSWRCFTHTETQKNTPGEAI